METDDGSTHTLQDASAMPIRVFNEDFVHENIRWNEDMAPIFMVGRDNIELQKKLSEQQTRVQGLRQQADEHERKATELEDHLNQQLTDEARRIRDGLSVQNYFRPKLREHVERTVREEAKPLDQPEVQTLRKRYHATERRDALPLIAPPDAKWAPLHDRVAETLQTCVQSEALDSLAEDPRLAQWVRSGLQLHRGKDRCQFCGAKLHDKRRKRLEAHFSDAYDDHIEAIDELTATLRDLMFDPEAPEEGLLYPDVREAYGKRRSELDEARDAHNTHVTSLIEVLERKRSTPFDAIPLDCSSPSLKLEACAQAVNDVIRRHNRQTQEFNEARAEARDTLILHYAAQFASNEHYVQVLEQIEAHRTTSEEAERKAEDFAEKCQQLRAELSGTVRGAEEVNAHLAALFGPRELSVRASEDDRFLVMRGDEPATNLSEGERTAISLAYFLARLHDRNTDVEETIVVLDDPISSLDSNHLFKAYSLIRTQLADAKQLFISTHNFPFFTLLKEWLDKKARYYLSERRVLNGSPSARLTKLPTLLRRFNSEYHYLFSFLYRFDRGETDQQNLPYILPNIARRYLEAFLGFKVPKKMGFPQKLANIVQDEQKKEAIVKFVNHYSHNRTLSRSLWFPDLAECKYVVATILDIVKAEDRRHYDALVEEVECFLRDSR